MDLGKIKSFLEWLVPRNVMEVRSFYGITIFYRTFVRNFSSIATSMIECMKGKTFQWKNIAQPSFHSSKRKMTEELVLTCIDFGKVFEVECNTSRVRIREVLIQEG